MMEPEFDKEIDAILRKARGDTTAVLAAAVTPHVDPDSIAAFAENALPEYAKRSLMEHFAECAHCRKLLSHTISMQTEADAIVASVAIEPLVETIVPWYERLFRTPNLAFTMGALVLAFSSIIGYLAIQNRDDSTSSVAQVTDQEKSKSDPYSNGAVSSATAANSNPFATNASRNSNTAAVANVPASSMPPAMSNSTIASAPNATRRGDSPVIKIPEDSKGMVLDGVIADEQRPVTAAAPLPSAKSELKENSTADSVTAERDKVKENVKDLAVNGRKSDDFDDRLAREAIPPSAKKAGPNRAAGPRTKQQETNLQSNVFTQNPTRNVGGKTFDIRNGIWYDLSYRGQSTKNVKRGSKDYNKVDGGLRSIAESLNGTIVVVWKKRAYRIQ